MKDLKNKNQINNLKMDFIHKVFEKCKKINELSQDLELEILDDVDHYQYANLKDWFDCFNKLNKLMEKRLNELAEMDLDQIEE